MKASPEKEVAINVTRETRKKLSRLLGILKGDIKFEPLDDNKGYGVYIKGHDDLKLRLHSSGALEINDRSSDIDQYKAVKKVEQIIEPFMDDFKGQDSYKVNVNKKAFVPKQAISDQVIFNKAEKSEKKSFGQKLKERFRIFTREMTEHQNLMAFAVGGVGVILANAVAAGNPEAAVCLKNIISNAGRWATLMSSVAGAAHPILYLAETKYGNIENRKLLKFMQGFRKFTNFAFMLSAGALVTDLMIPDQKVETATAPVQEDGSEKLAKGHHTIVYDSSNTDNGDVNSNVPSANIEPERHIDENTPVVGHTDVQVTQILDSVYENQLEDADWVNNVDNNGQDLSNVLLDQTFEYLVQNGHDVHSIDFSDFFENRSDYLNEDQIKYLDRIAKTGDVSDYISLLKSD